MSKIFLKGLVKKISDKEYQVVASTNSIDRQGDSIDQTGWKIDNYMKNPVMLWAHDYSDLPVAKCINLSFDNSDQMVASFEFAPEDANPKAAQIQKLYDEGFLNAVSVGFIPNKRSGNIITEAELLEISFVPVPANQDALRLAMEKGLNISLIKKQLEKGEVADELNAEEIIEQKYDNLDGMFQVIYAMCNVYCDPVTPVGDFQKLLTETIGLLQQLANGQMTEADASKVAQFKDISIRARALINEKAGRKLSADTMKALDTIHQSIKAADTAMESLKSSATVGDGSSDDEKGARSIGQNEIVLDSKDVEHIRKALQVSDKHTEFVLGLLKTILEKKR